MRSAPTLYIQRDPNGALVEPSGGGHCSPMAAYDEQEDLVLLLDPRGRYHWAWLPLASLYEAMNTTDEAGQAHRGWVTVTK